MPLTAPSTGPPAPFCYYPVRPTLHYRSDVLQLKHMIRNRAVGRMLAEIVSILSGRRRIRDVCIGSASVIS